MVIWFALLIPVAIALYLGKAHGRRVTRWELAGLLLVAVLSVAVAKWTVEKVQTDDVEYWGGWIQSASYFEDWDERVRCRHEQYHTESYTTTNSKGESVTRTRRVSDGYAHAYDVDYHPEYWQAVNSNGETISLRRPEFERLAQRFGNRVRVELYRRYHTNDGDQYGTTWKGNEAAFEPCVTEHRYENRVQASTSLYKPRMLSSERRAQYRVFDYPALHGYAMDSLLGDAGPRTAEANAYLNRINARLGAKKQVRLWVLVFKNQPREAGFAQEDHWVGGNKNEFILTVGVDDRYRVQWAHPISWTKVEGLKIDARNVVQGQPTFDPVALAKWLETEVDARFVRRPFKEFNYLTVEPPLKSVLLSYLFVTLASVLFSLWAYFNRFRTQEPPPEKPADEPYVSIFRQ